MNNAWFSTSGQWGESMTAGKEDRKGGGRLTHSFLTFASKVTTGFCSEVSFALDWNQTLQLTLFLHDVADWTWILVLTLLTCLYHYSYVHQACDQCDPVVDRNKESELFVAICRKEIIYKASIKFTHKEKSLFTSMQQSFPRTWGGDIYTTSPH